MYLDGFRDSADSNARSTHLVRDTSPRAASTAANNSADTRNSNRPLLAIHPPYGNRRTDKYGNRRFISKIPETRPNEDFGLVGNEALPRPPGCLPGWLQAVSRHNGITQRTTHHVPSCAHPEGTRRGICPYAEPDCACHGDRRHQPDQLVRSALMRLSLTRVCATALDRESLFLGRGLVFAGDVFGGAVDGEAEPSG